jgi:hypothetical protein
MTTPLSPEREQQIRAELRDRRTEDLNLRGLLAPDGQPRRVPMELGASLVPAVEWLLAELATAMDNYHGESQHGRKLSQAVSEAHDVLDELQAPVFGLHDIAARIIAWREQIRTDVVPLWEAVYEPGNVSDYLIGYANDEAPAKAAAASWFVSQQLDEVGRLVWADQGPGAGCSAWFDLIHVDPELGEVSTGITVRRRVPAVVPAAGEANR